MVNHKSTRSKAQRRDASINCKLLEAGLFRLRQHTAGRNHAADLCGRHARLHTYASVQRRNRCQRREGEPEMHSCVLEAEVSAVVPKTGLFWGEAADIDSA